MCSDNTADLPWWAASTTRPIMTPSQVRTRTLRGTLTAVAVLVLLAAGMTGVLTSGTAPATQPTINGGVQRRQSLQALLGGCGPIFEFPAQPGKIGTVPATRPDGRPYYQPYDQFGTTVPVFGPFWPTPAPTGKVFYTTGDPDAPQPENLLRSQWDGWMTVYYTADANPADVQHLRTLAQTQPQWKMIVVPWPHRYGPMPHDRKIAFSAWDNSQTCQRLVGAALDEFRTLHPATAAPGAHGTPPPVKIAG